CSSAAPVAPEISTLSLHDALPILYQNGSHGTAPLVETRLDDEALGGRFDRSGQLKNFGLQKHVFEELVYALARFGRHTDERDVRSEEHTSELQSRENLVCRLLLEK